MDSPATVIPASDNRPTSGQKLLFWAILGGLSVFFAEVTIGSSPFAFFDPWGILVVCPLYLLHVLTLAWIVLRQGRPRFSALLFAGILFGLYEAYMTKQLWNPTWSPTPMRIGGVAVWETMVLVLWWHPLMAFVMPLLVAETALCRSRHVARSLPERVQRMLFGRRGGVTLVVLAVGFGLILSSAPEYRPTAGHVLVSAVASAGVVLGLVWLWRRWTRGVRFALPDLLPTRREMVLLCICLGLQYVGLGLIVRPEALPGVGPQASVWLLYALAIGGLWLSLRRPRRPHMLGTGDPPDRFSWRTWLGLAGVLAATATVARLLLGAGTGWFLLANLVVGVLAGISILIACIRDIRRHVPAALPGVSSSGGA